ncbi:hypothetical protein CesoFtcFv8_023735 [Champsocephalus esox]|nr:hypothetical protein CesoFtcFv8_023735 [Champsocephalus esox]
MDAKPDVSAQPWDRGAPVVRSKAGAPLHFPFLNVREDSAHSVPDVHHEDSINDQHQPQPASVHNIPPVIPQSTQPALPRGPTPPYAQTISHLSYPKAQPALPRGPRPPTPRPYPTCHTPKHSQLCHEGHAPLCPDHIPPVIPQSTASSATRATPPYAQTISHLSYPKAQPALPRGPRPPMPRPYPTCHTPKHSQLCHKATPPYAQHSTG